MTNNSNDNKPNIQCEWMKTKRALVNYDGQVYPCCYFANNFSIETLFGDKLGREDIQYGGFEISKHDALTKKKEHIHQTYVDNKKNLNIMEGSLSDILQHEWFTKTLPESWNDEDKTHRLCKKFCQVGSDFRIENKSKVNDE